MVLLSVVMALVTMLAACGESDSAAQPGSGEGSGGGAFPVSIEHKYGTTEIPSEPTRIVTVGWTDDEPVLALGEKPVGVTDFFGERPYGSWPWTADKWGDTEPTILGERDEYSLEEVAALQPDLILSMYSAIDRDRYDKLSRIAPTVAQPAGYENFRAPWQETTRIVGRALGRSEKAERLIADIDKRYAQIRKDNPGFAETTIAALDSSQPGKFAIFNPEGAKAKFLTNMGFQFPDALSDIVGDKPLYQLSSERAEALDIDRLVMLYDDAKAKKRIKNDPVFSQLDVYTEDRVVFVPYEDPPIGAALSFSSANSIPYALDQIVPQLAELQ